MTFTTQRHYPIFHAPGFEWSATSPGYEPGEPIGWASTEQEAIEDLKQQLEEQTA